MEKVIVLHSLSCILVFQELRDENIARVVRSLNEKAIQVKGGYDGGAGGAEESEARPQDGNSTINEIIDFRYKLPELIQKKKFLETHLGVGARAGAEA